MEGFTIIDAVAAAVILLSALLAWSRGFVREAMAILGWIAAAVVAFIFAPSVAPIVREIPYVGDFLSDSCELSMIASFAVVFALALVVVSLFTPLFSSAVRNSALSGLDQGLGFLFGVARGVLLVAVALVVYDRVVLNETVPIVDNSRTAQVFRNIEGALDEAIPDSAPSWIVARYEELVGGCSGGAAEPR
ncbi:membrane protein required for colicin V production [Meinhardsimonia xiamenensis]|jgi:membrane protein required for colicin V production|uniref:Membrane protein required for colicin V production n=1 Tax=Meinhardsimonia xiamenensis TaxID=990712 RepID=A0A1G9AL10_9RHOB|nr:CvpA family protein [Meinhardsimonia xiamenensis]PRX35336.1 membrane protein required for colicin V production [Meinhardsimonia xiamenensis]SDK27997.1 membrane protein required for colicin V production [Meinhardsimonia xiamenensis]